MAAHAAHAAGTWRLRLKNLPVSFAQEAPSSAKKLHRILFNQLNITVLKASTYKNWTRVDGSYSYAFVEVPDESTGNLLITRAPTCILDGMPLHAEWCHDSLPGLRLYATQVTHPNHPGLTWYHSDRELLCVFDHINNIPLPRESWPQLYFTHPSPPNAGDVPASFTDGGAPPPVGDDTDDPDPPSPSGASSSRSLQPSPPTPSHVDPTHVVPDAAPCDVVALPSLSPPTPSHVDPTHDVPDAAPCDVVALPSPSPLPSPPSLDLVPLPYPFRRLSPGALANFLDTHQDFRMSTIQCVTLPSPWILASTELTHFTEHYDSPSQVSNLPEGSVWDLSWEFACPNAPTWVTQSNRSLHIDINRWLLDNVRDPWRGLQATTTRTIARNPSHAVFLDLPAGQTVTILGQPFWCWHDTNMLDGTYVVPVATYNYSSPVPSTTSSPSSSSTSSSTESPVATLGLAPVRAFLPLPLT